MRTLFLPAMSLQSAQQHQRQHDYHSQQPLRRRVAEVCVCGLWLVQLQYENDKLVTEIEDLRGENEELKAELGALDPAFFEEIEDLKHEHYNLQNMCTEYENIVRDYARELGATFLHPRPTEQLLFCWQHWDRNHGRSLAPMHPCYTTTASRTQSSRLLR